MQPRPRPRPAAVHPARAVPHALGHERAGRQRLARCSSLRCRLPRLLQTARVSVTAGTHRLRIGAHEEKGESRDALHVVALAAGVNRGLSRMLDTLCRLIGRAEAIRLNLTSAPFLESSTDARRPMMAAYFRNSSSGI